MARQARTDGGSMCGDQGWYTPDFRPFGDSRRLLDIRHMAITLYIAYFSWSPLITATLAIHPALSSATPSSFVPSYLLSTHLPFQGCSCFTSGEEITPTTARNSKYSPTLATKCSLRSSPSGRPSFGASLWGRERRASGLSIEVV